MMAARSPIAQCHVRWKPEEDLVLIEHVRRHGTRQWKQLLESGKLPGRDNKACCNRYRIIRHRLPGSSADVNQQENSSSPDKLQSFDSIDAFLTHSNDMNLDPKDELQNAQDDQNEGWVWPKVPDGEGYGLAGSRKKMKVVCERRGREGIDFGDSKERRGQELGQEKSGGGATESSSGGGGQDSLSAASENDFQQTTSSAQSPSPSSADELRDSFLLQFSTWHPSDPFIFPPAPFSMDPAAFLDTSACMSPLGEPSRGSAESSAMDVHTGHTTDPLTIRCATIHCPGGLTNEGAARASGPAPGPRGAPASGPTACLAQSPRPAPAPGSRAAPAQSPAGLLSPMSAGSPAVQASPATPAAENGTNRSFQVLSMHASDNKVEQELTGLYFEVQPDDAIVFGASEVIESLEPGTALGPNDLLSFMDTPPSPPSFPSPHSFGLASSLPLVTPFVHGKEDSPKVHSCTNSVLPMGTRRWRQKQCSTSALQAHRAPKTSTDAHIDCAKVKHGATADWQKPLPGLPQEEGMRNGAQETRAHSYSELIKEQAAKFAEPHCEHNAFLGGLELVVSSALLRKCV